MANPHSGHIGRKIWNGEYRNDQGALRLHWQEYRITPGSTEDRIPWMSTLYSSLAGLKKQAKQRDLSAALLLLWCLCQLYLQIRYFIGLRKADLDRRMTAPQMETVASILFAWSQQVPSGESVFYAASRYAHCGFPKAKAQHEPGSHVLALFALTFARIYQVENLHKQAMDMLDIASKDIDLIADPNQRARVYRGCAELSWALHHELEQALSYLAGADNVPGIGADVKMKNELAYESILNAI